MSMDDQYQQMVRFTRSLEEFNERLRSTMADLEMQNELLTTLWQDEMRKDYDREWEPLHQQMQVYIRREGRQYMDFLTTKQRVLERYMHGG